MAEMYRVPPETDMKARRLLGQLDRSLRQDLKKVSLIAELQVDASQAANYAKYVTLATRFYSLGEKATRIPDEWPAVWAVAVAGFAVEGYQRGGYWPALRKAIDGYIQTDDLPSALKEAFLDSLQRLGLPTVRDPGAHTYLSNVVLHSGIPNYCLNDWFQMLHLAANQSGDDSEYVMHWCRQRLSGSSLGFVDKPIRLILEDGEEFAMDLIDRSLTAMSIGLDARADELESPSLFTPAALPSRFTVALVRWLGRDKRATSPTSGRKSRRAVPHVELDLASGDIVLVFPPVPDADGSFRWWVNLDNHRLIHAEPEVAWTNDLNGVEGTSVPIPEPARLLRVESSLANEAQIRLIDPSRPVLAFDASGRRLSPFSPLPAGLVWLTLLGGHRHGLTIDGQAVKEVAHADPPIGWAGWETICLDLSRGRSLASKNSDFPYSWVISSVRSAAVIAAAPIDTVRIDGFPVHAERPLVELPADGEPTTWHIRIDDVRSGRTITARDWIVEELTAVDPWPKSERVAGLFDITVRGPLGRGTKRVIAVMEGLTYLAHPTIRYVDLSGMQRAMVSLRSASSGEQQDLEFGPRDIRRTHVFAGQTLTVYPHAIAVAATGPDVLPTWGHKPLRIPTEELSQRSLMVRSLPNTYLRPWVSANGRPVQELRPSKRDDAVLVFDLAAVTDTAEQYGKVHIELRDPDDEGGAVIPLATLAPRDLCSGGELVDGDRAGIQLQDYRHADSECFVWASAAPWLSPLRLTPDRTGFLSLPAEWTQLGDLLVHWRIVDDWAPQPAPYWPSSKDICVRALPHHLPDEPRSLYLLAPEGIAPELAPADAWKVLRFLETTQMTLGSEAHQWVIRSLRNAAAESLLTLGDLTEDAALTVGLMARAGLCATDTRSTELSEEELVRLVRRNWLIGGLFACRHAHGNDRSETLLALVEQIGTPIEDVLRGDPDSAAAGGAFDRQTERLDLIDEQQLETLVSQLGLVPRAPVDLDSRTRAGLAAFQGRHRATRLRRDARPLASAVEDALKANGLSRPTAALTARRHPDRPNGWLALSEASFALALASRFAAYGYADLKSISERFESWQFLPEPLRPLHAIDVVLAEGYASCHAAQGSDDHA